MLRVLVIGARRQRQGIGEFVTRFLAQAGASVCGVIGTSEASARQASANLEQYGIRAASYTDLATALRQERPDVVAICSPFHVHRQQLEMVATEGCHCLCEKPLWWNDTPLPEREETEQLVDHFVQRGLYLALVAQWPYTLPEFYRLYPELQGVAVEEFAMHLGPISCGPGMVLDAAPHLLSMLQQMLGCGHVSDAVAKYLYADERDLCLEFTYVHDSGAARVRCRLTTTETPPRPASYGINGKFVERLIELPQYDLCFVAPESQQSSSGTQSAAQRKIAIKDPLELLVEDFVRKVKGGVQTDRRSLIESMVGLKQLFETVRV